MGAGLVLGGFGGLVGLGEAGADAELDSTPSWVFPLLRGDKGIGGKGSLPLFARGDLGRDVERLRGSSKLGTGGKALLPLGVRVPEVGDELEADAELDSTPSWVFPLLRGDKGIGGKGSLPLFARGGDGSLGSDVERLRVLSRLGESEADAELDLPPGLGVLSVFEGFAGLVCSVSSPEYSDSW